MASMFRVRGFSPELRASLFHFTVFLSNGTAAVYFGIWLTTKDITADEIGMINALPVLIMLAINVFIGRIADKADDWRQMIIILALIAGVVPLGMFFVNEFWGFLLVWAMLHVPAGSIPPVVDAATMRMTQRNGSDFGSIRAWGTVGYMVSTVISGLAIAFFGSTAFLPIFVGFCLLRAALALQLPRFRAPVQETTVSAINPIAGKLRDVLKPWFVLPLVGFALINATHGILTAFAALVWKDQGISEGLIGPLLAVGAAAEALMMFFWSRFGWRISARQMILIAGIATAFRWTVMAFNPPVEVLFGLQTLHALTFAVGYFGAVQFVANWTSEEIAAEAQGFSFVLQQLMVVSGLLVFGWLVGQWGIKSFFIAAALGMAAMACVLISLRLRPSSKDSLPGTA